MGDPHPEHAQLQADRIYLGWQYALLYPDPGPPPKRPAREDVTEPPADADTEWIHRERLQKDLLNRPVKIFRTFMAVVAAGILVLGVTGLLNWSFVMLGLVAAGGVAAICTYAIRQGDRTVNERLDARRRKALREQERRRQEIVTAQEEHAAKYRDWAEKKNRFDQQINWYAVAVPDDIDRVDVAGGTLTGWSALLTLIGATRLYSGGHLTVLDLSEGAIAKDLIELARRGGDDPLVWVLPVDLPRLDLGATLKPEAFADVLAHVVSVSEETSRDIGFDNAILERVLEVLGENATISQVTAALRALAQVGDPRDDMKGGLLTASQLERIGMLFGRGVADRVVIERAWALESQLRKLETLGSQAVRLPPARLRVVSMDRQAGVFGNRVLGTYVATALTHILRQSPASERPWYHTIIVAGADKLRGDVLDRLMDACETSRTGLVLTYRSLTPTVRERLGRGHAAVAFMRLGNAEDARVASEHVGTEHRLELAQLTETFSSAVNGPSGFYTSTVGESRTEGEEKGDGDLREDITESTEWGRRAPTVADGVLQRSREFLVEPHQLQQLPTTSVIVTYSTAEGRQVRLADANPAILTFPKTTLGEFEEIRRAALAPPEPEPEPEPEEPVLPDVPPNLPPNLGPPPPRLDWRKRS
ncbi:hypothetical protein [Microbispora bryophytorum]|uniref:Uncharacterized protein n=1 Tax=Microbispora bryophytorum TaxID=1460882 RepID=A0A8H9H180_9ACTN|nr:hypothetical protein [Microbispora bryophytorum]MBD3139578.1 hypothetical protein [Microbispora bryophytorum]TQS02870.1 hypothetical protein FLX07_26430 [Microbispora bryophytorum]GGO02765.1 hypothetical protein GCM10011574_11900 [Microbispora bryophytorum]